MAISIYYIIPNPIYNPPCGQSFRAFMTCEKTGTYLYYWKDRNKAFEYLKQNVSDESFGVIHSTLEILQKEIESKPFEIKLKLIE
jgi:hypothetical protein